MAGRIQNSRPCGTPVGVPLFESWRHVRARQAFVERGGIDVAAFDIQVGAIQRAGLPQNLGARVVDALGKAGEYKAPEAITWELFGAA